MTYNVFGGTLNLTQPYPFPLQLRRNTKVEVAEPIHCRIIAFLLLILYITL